MTIGSTPSPERRSPSRLLRRAAPPLLILALLSLPLFAGALTGADDGDAPGRVQHRFDLTLTQLRAGDVDQRAPTENCVAIDGMRLRAGYATARWASVVPSQKLELFVHVPGSTLTRIAGTAPLSLPIPDVAERTPGGTVHVGLLLPFGEDGAAPRQRATLELTLDHFGAAPTTRPIACA